MQNPNHFRSAHSQLESIDAAIEQLIDGIGGDDVPDMPPARVVVFASPHFTGSLSKLCESISARVAPENTMGCTGESIVTDAEEIESEPCIALWAAWLPNANIELMHLAFERSPDGGSFTGLSGLLKSDWPADLTLLMLAEPYSFPADVFLERNNGNHPHTQIIGGMASGGTRPGESKLIFNDSVVDQGAVVAAIHGAQITSVVSQGCRPIGEPLVITKAEQNVIYELGGKKAAEQLQAVYDRLANRDRELMRLGIHVGRVVNEYQDTFDYGDFLIRNVMGIHAEDGSIVVGDFFRPGQTIQFHLRDGCTASEDLRQMLRRSTYNSKPKASLLFTCNGRGTRLFDDPHHDAQAIRQKMGDIPNAGFFCQGEIGPVAGVNFLHGFTASVAFFH